MSRLKNIAATLKKTADGFTITDAFSELFRVLVGGLSYDDKLSAAREKSEEAGQRIRAFAAARQAGESLERPTGQTDVSSKKFSESQP